MQRILRTLLVVVGVVYASGASALPFLGINENGNVYRLSSSDSSEVLLGSLNTPSSDLAGLTFSGNTDYYTFARDLNTIVHFNPQTLAITHTATIDQNIPTAPRGYDVNSNGELFIASTGNNIYRLNPFTGVTTFVVNVNLGLNLEGLAFSDTDILYAVAGQGNFYEIDLTLGTAISITSFGFDGDTLAFASDGFLYSAEAGSGSRPFVRVDPLTGSTTVLRSYSPGYNGLAELVTTPVPEPATLAVFGIGLAGLVGLRRRRRANTVHCMNM